MISRSNDFNTGVQLNEKNMSVDLATKSDMLKDATAAVTAPASVVIPINREVSLSSSTKGPKRALGQ